MAGLGNRRGSKTSSGSGSARDRISAAREKMGGSSRSSSKGISGGAKGRPKIGGGSKGGYILTESVDNLIGGKFTKKGGTGAKRVSREDLIEARKKRAEQETKSGKRMRPTGEREGVAPKRPTREGLFKKGGSKPGGVEAFKPSDKSRSPRPTRVGIGGKGGPKAGGNQIDKVRGPKKGGVIGGSGRDLTKARPGGNQIDKVRGPKNGSGPKRRPAGGNQSIGQTGGNVGPGGKGPNRTGGGPKSGIGQGGKRGGPPRQTGGNVGPGGKGPNRAGLTEYGIF